MGLHKRLAPRPVTCVAAALVDAAAGIEGVRRPVFRQGRQWSRVQVAGLPRTKIVATLGPASMSVDVVRRMVEAGMSVARINLAHGSHKDHAQFVRVVRRVAKEVGRPIAVMADLAGPKIRVGSLKDGRVELARGDVVVLTTESVEGTKDRISVSEPHLPHDVKKGQPIFLADGTLELLTQRISGNDIECRVVHGGLLLPSKGVNLPKTKLHLESLTPRDRASLARLKTLGVDIVALSFVRRVDDLVRARKAMGSWRPPIVAKIEKAEAVRNLSAILEEADGVMVARGDLGVETSMEELPSIQKRIIRRANDLGKPVITATQMLLSMVESTRPTRAEAADVANAILDGSDAVMLSEETAMGKHPARVIETMARIAKRAEQDLDVNAFVVNTARADWVAGAVSEAAVHVARTLGAKAIVTPTRGGTTPRTVARLRPPMPIVALSDDPAVVQFLCLSWGVYPEMQPRTRGFEGALSSGVEVVRRQGFAVDGDRVVVTAGYPRRFTSNLMSVQTLTKGDKKRQR